MQWRKLLSLLVHWCNGYSRTLHYKTREGVHAYVYDCHGSDVTRRHSLLYFIACKTLYSVVMETREAGPLYATPCSGLGSLSSNTVSVPPRTYKLVRDPQR